MDSTNTLSSYTAPLVPGPKTPAHQHVYERVRALILFGDLAPAEAVTVQGLTTTLSVGMTPAREAIRRLVAEGALIHQDNRRVCVPKLTANCINDLGFMRKTLEPELTRRAVKRMTPPVLETLRQTDDALNKTINMGDVGGYLLHNYQFHALLYQSADAPIMSATVDRLWLRFGPSLRVVCGRFGTGNLPDKHADLLAALSKGNVADAVQAMIEDVDQGMRQIATALTE